MSAAHLTELLFIGFFTAAGLYSALLFLITRNRPFLWYAALMDTMAAAQLVFAPDLLGLDPSGKPLMIYRAISFGAFFTAEAIFAASFMKLPSRSPWFAKGVFAVLGLNLLMLGAQFVTGPAEWYRIVEPLLFLALLAVCGTAAWEAAANGHEDARYYLVAFGGALLGVIASATTEHLGIAYWPEYFFQFGVSWQGALLAIALASRYAKLDPLTGVKSRRAFDERLTMAWRTAHKHTTGLAVIFVAVDGFKDYDARFGRIAGDALLRRIANLCSGCCRDRADLFARYGDEEFAAIIPRVSQAQADAVALRMRQLVAEACLITISAAAATIDGGAQSATELLESAVALVSPPEPPFRATVQV